jgi:hypothetical protein
MDMRREFDEAISLGKANVSVLELARNFCEHLRVETLASGALEAETSLPIGPRMFDCEHATGKRIGGMDLRYVAVSFYDNNCKDCGKRKPRGLPNLLDLVRDRDAELDRINTEFERQRLRESTALQAREAARADLRIGLPATALGLIDLVARVDRENSEATSQVLVETARTVPEQFTQPIQIALKQLAEAEGEHRVTAALLALKAVGADRTVWHAARQPRFSRKEVLRSLTPRRFRAQSRPSSLRPFHSAISSNPTLSGRQRLLPRLSSCTASVRGKRDVYCDTF